MQAATDELLELSDAAALVPGPPVNLSTLRRWVTAGVRNVRLKAVRRGGKWLTSRRSIEDFMRHTTAAALGEPTE